MHNNIFLHSALDQANLALAISSPNPRVGCVIVDETNNVLGKGFTQKKGASHAEIMALRDAEHNGFDVRGATAYVTLEPCSHHGRTPPCCDALIAAGIKKVVASIADPNPLVAGRGFERLRAAGIEVIVGPSAAESRELNIGFFSRMIRKTPWVRMKIAASLDGGTALMNGESQWITGEVARTDGHAWRARSCAILTGIGTILEDNPRLDVRLIDAPRQPHLVIVDSRLETPLDALVLNTVRRVFIYTCTPNLRRKSELESLGVTVITMPGPNGKVDLTAMLHDLAEREVNELHVEAGHKLNGSLTRENLVDELLVYLAPKLIGKAQGMASFGPLDSLDESVQLNFLESEMVGNDLRLRARIADRDQF